MLCCHGVKDYYWLLGLSVYCEGYLLVWTGRSQSAQLRRLLTKPTALRAGTVDREAKETDLDGLRLQA